MWPACKMIRVRQKGHAGSCQAECADMPDHGKMPAGEISESPSQRCAPALLQDNIGRIRSAIDLDLRAYG